MLFIMRKSFSPILALFLVVIFLSSGCVKKTVCGDKICEEGEETICPKDCARLEPCSDQKGIICTEAQTCQGDLINAKDSQGCCVGICRDKEDCSDGTKNNSCSERKPLFCEGGNLIENCEVCSCDNLLLCSSSGACTRKEGPNPNFDCIFCDGFCYAKLPDRLNMNSYCTKDEVLHEWWGDLEGKHCNLNSDCVNQQSCVDNRCLTEGLFVQGDESEITLSLEYPKFVKLGEPFVFKILAENLGSKAAKLRISDLYGTYLEAPSVDYDDKFSFDEEKEVLPNAGAVFEINIPKMTRKSFVGGFSFKLLLNDRIERHIHTLNRGPIIVGECADYEIEVCGNRKYCSGTALCLDGILYPASSNGKSCLTNSDCGSNLLCLNYSCRGPKSKGGLVLEKTNKIGVLGIFMYDDKEKYQKIKKDKIEELKALSSNANGWFNSERKYWKATNKF